VTESIKISYGVTYN
jgi:hypothetical protein